MASTTIDWHGYDPVLVLSRESLWVPKFQRPLSISWLRSKTGPAYQREGLCVLDVADSSTWDSADSFAGDLAGTPGMYAVLDGQGRFELARHEGEEWLRCIVHPWSRQDAAKQAVLINGGRRDIKPYYRIRMEWAAEYRDALEVRARVQNAGFQLGPDTDHNRVVGAVTAAEDLYYGRRGIRLHVRQDVLTPTLLLIGNSFVGRQASLDADLLRGIGMVVASRPVGRVDEERLAAVLAARMPLQWISGTGRSAADQHSRAKSIAWEVAREYNEGRIARFGRLPKEHWIDLNTSFADEKTPGDTKPDA